MNRPFVNALLVGGVLVFIGVMRSSAQQGNNGESEVQRGFDIAPVHLNLAGKNRSLVGLGSYYVNGPSDCVGCHSGDTGHLGGGVDFDVVLTRNLTPDAAGNPAGLTLSEFKAVMRLGTDFKGIDPNVGGNPGFLIIMPWIAYQHGTDRYLEAIYELLEIDSLHRRRAGLYVAPLLASRPPCPVTSMLQDGQFDELF